ncbi:hypothetical protein F4808DRAFT_458209 [Astrocystis sublimbata]|nr:hypothetical protein F4808DRAFT_458209 [Astrocystis sublimbata]
MSLRVTNPDNLGEPSGSNPEVPELSLDDSSSSDSNSYSNGSPRNSSYLPSYLTTSTANTSVENLPIHNHNGPNNFMANPNPPADWVPIGAFAPVHLQNPGQTSAVILRTNDDGNYGNAGNDSNTNTDTDSTSSRNNNSSTSNNNNNNNRPGKMT